MNILTVLLALVSLLFAICQTIYAIKQLHLSVRPYAVFFGDKSYLQLDNPNSFYATRSKGTPQTVYLDIFIQCHCSNGYMVLKHAMAYFREQPCRGMRSLFRTPPDYFSSTEYYLQNLGFIKKSVTVDLEVFEKAVVMYYGIVYSDQHERRYCSMLKLNIAKTPLGATTGFSEYSIEHMYLSPGAVNRIRKSMHDAEKKEQTNG